MVEPVIYTTQELDVCRREADLLIETGRAFSAKSDMNNALDAAMIDALIEAGRVLFDMRELRCVVLAGDGPSFCAGIDLSGFSTAPDEDHVMLTDRTHGNANRFQQTAMQWYKLPVPVIAAVHGACFGGGLQVRY